MNGILFKGSRETSITYYPQDTLRKSFGSGVIQSYALDKELLKNIGSSGFRKVASFAGQMTGYGVHYYGHTRVTTPYNPWQYQGLGQKSFVGTYKSLMHTLMIK